MSNFSGGHDFFPGQCCWFKDEHGIHYVGLVVDKDGEKLLIDYGGKLLSRRSDEVSHFYVEEDDD